MLSAKARQDNHDQQEAAAVNKSLLTIDYASMYSVITYRHTPTQFQS